MRSGSRVLLATATGLVGVGALAAALSTPETATTASVGTGGGRGVARAFAVTVVLLALVAAPLVLLTVRRGTPTGTGDARFAGVVVLLGCLLVSVVAFLLANANGSAATLPTGAGGLGPLGAGDRSAPGPESGPTGTGLAGLAVVAAVGLAGVALFLVRFRTPEESLDGTGSSADDDPAATRQAVAATAGAAADRLAAGDRPVDNVVYRAWREMTAALDVGDPDTTTPGEFAAAAVDSGLDPDAVSDLTAMFETVRYGDGDPASHESRARRALERVGRETEHATGNAAGIRNAAETGNTTETGNAAGTGNTAETDTEEDR